MIYYYRKNNMFLSRILKPIKFILFMIMCTMSYTMIQAMQQEEHATNYFELIPEEIYEKIVSNVISANTKSSQLLEALQVFTNFACTNKDNNNRLKFDTYLKLVRKTLGTAITSDDQMDTLIAEIKKNKIQIHPFCKSISALFDNIAHIRIHLSLNFEGKKTNKNAIKTYMEKIIDAGYSPDFVINNRNLLYLFDFTHYPELAIDLLKKGASVHTKRMPKVFFMNPLYFNKPECSEYQLCKELVMLLVKKGLRPNYAFHIPEAQTLHLSEDTWYPLLSLTMFCFNRDSELLNTLLSHGAKHDLFYFTYGRGSSTPWKDAEAIQDEHPEVLALMKKYRDKEKVAAVITENEQNEKNIQL